MDLFGNTHSHSLYIIGNGFDLAHGMKTSWQDFYDWLKSNGYNPLITFCENNFSFRDPTYGKISRRLLGNMILIQYLIIAQKILRLTKNT
jgi:hypothetical protein